MATSEFHGYQAVMRLAVDPDKAEKWLPVVVSAYRWAVRVHDKGGEFAGAWVVADSGWVPNLRVLGAYGIVQKSGSSRGGQRAYYRMADLQGVKRALTELHRIEPD